MVDERQTSLFDFCAKPLKFAYHSAPHDLPPRATARVTCDIPVCRQKVA